MSPLKNVNHAPVADAGVNQQVKEETVVNLHGEACYDPDGDALTYSWRQLTGSGVALSDPTAATPTFTAPTVGASGVPQTRSTSLSSMTRAS